MFIEFIDALEKFTNRPTSKSHSILLTTQFAVTLQFFCNWHFSNCGCFLPWHFTVYNFAMYLHYNSSLCACAKDSIYFPFVDGETRNQQRFQDKYGFLIVLGCVDGSHVPIVAPSTNEHLYVNRKGYHSINVEIICEADFRFTDLVVKWPGSTHDAFIWRQSGINQMIDSGEIATVNGWFLVDSGYMLRKNLMTPILSPLTTGDIRYNRAFFTTRKMVECTFGISKSRWRS